MQRNGMDQVAKLAERGELKKIFNAERVQDAYTFYRVFLKDDSIKIKEIKGKLRMTKFKIIGVSVFAGSLCLNIINKK